MAGPLTMEYRQTRAALRDASSIALDALDAAHAAMTYGDLAKAHEACRVLLLTADDMAALVERLRRLVAESN